MTRRIKNPRRSRSSHTHSARAGSANAAASPSHTRKNPTPHRSNGHHPRHEAWLARQPPPSGGAMRDTHPKDLRLAVQIPIKRVWNKRLFSISARPDNAALHLVGRMVHRIPVTRTVITPAKYLILRQPTLRSFRPTSQEACIASPKEFFAPPYQRQSGFVLVQKLSALSQSGGQASGCSAPCTSARR